MKKRIKLKKWVIYALIIINCFLAICLTADCENFIIFTISKIVLLTAFLFNNSILFKYSDFFE